MAERLHPGVYVEERTSGLAPIQGVSTSNMGIVGFTSRGPVDDATLVTSFEQFKATFGDFTEDSQVPTHVYAFFANGGRRAYIVRAIPSDAATADGFIGNSFEEESIFAGDGLEDDFTAATGVGPLVAANLPIQPSTVSITYYETGASVAAEVAVPNAVPDGAQLDFSFKLALLPISGTVSIETTVTAGAVLYDDAATPGILQDVGNTTRGYVDYETGLVTLSVATGQEPDALTDIETTYDQRGALATIVDDGAGLLTGATLNGAATVDYTTGELDFDVTGSAIPAAGLPINLAYDHNQWDIDPVSGGLWGNGLRVDVRGDEDFFTRATASYSRYDALVYLDGVLQDVFENLSVDDPTDARYIASVLNAVGVGSDLLSLVEPSNSDVLFGCLNGLARALAVGAGDGAQLDFGSTDGTGGTPTIPVAFRAAALQTPIQPGSLTIAYTDSGGTARTISDDGNGNLTGTDLDGAAPAGFNVVNYTTGAFAFRVLTAISQADQTNDGLTLTPGALAVASYYKTPNAAATSDTLTGGTDGTSVDRAVLTSPALLADRRGVYALLPTNELQNVVVPDAAGNVPMSLDLTTEAERNEKWFIPLATTPGLSPQEAQDYRRNTLGSTSSYAALYYPYIRIQDPVTDLPVDIPPGGHIAGIYARTDTTKSVAKTPAGVQDGKINFSIGLERNLEFAEIDILHPYQVNSLIDTPVTGRVVWGGRTLENPPADFRFVAVRRLFNFLKLSIFNSTHGFVFEDVGPSLQSRIRLSVESFLTVLFSQGFFAGTSPIEAFNVVCDATNNPPEVAATGTVICDIYVATQTPGEFIVFRIQQKFNQAA
jgi:phage tail sheath protein FI